ncbi:MAG TPA: GNAT family N-acetyltransferase [Klebsiella pneumoniae]|nr:GNAT family N-acetyltransferase [Klebsiella pneumoniae]
MVFIRAAEAKDIPSLQTLFLQLGYQTETAILAQRITAPQSMMSTLVAETENAVCGVIVIHFILPVHENRLNKIDNDYAVCGVIVINFILPVHENRLWALISALVIEESSRGSGIGQQLLQAAERLARDKQCAQIELSSSEKRIRAHQFYENNGYKEVRKRFVKHLS